MIKPSQILKKNNTYIIEKLHAIEDEYKIIIILAIELGSRAWGFPSPDSDYDVRFLYKRSYNDYLSVKSYRDVIETEINEDIFLEVPLDIGGWDIKKALQLALNSNAVLYEWLSSPIRYIENKKEVSILSQFFKSTANLTSLSYHYYQLTNNAWQQIAKSDGMPKIKLYCYALRPALSLFWIKNEGNIPPMDIYQLAQHPKLDSSFYHELDQLVEVKSTANEKQLISSNNILDKFICSLLDINITKVGLDNLQKKEFIENADEIFRKIIR